MGCCVYFFQCSRTWLALLVPIFAVFARLSSGHGAFFIPFTFIFLSTIFLLTFSKTKPITSLLNEAADNEQEKHQPTLLQGTSSSITTYADDSVAEADDEEEAVMDSYSESDQFSSSSSEDDHSSDLEQRLECSDGSISDEESLIEIAIPSGQFVSPDKDLRWNVKCCKEFHKDFWAEMNEEDNLIEIDIYMGSIKCSSF